MTESGNSFGDGFEIKTEEVEIKQEIDFYNGDEYWPCKEMVKTECFEFKVNLNACYDNAGFYHENSVQKENSELKRKFKLKLNGSEEKEVSKAENVSTSLAAHQSHQKHPLVNDNQDKPYKCNMCPYVSTQKRYLHDHMRIHNPEKPYKCNICSYATPFKSSFQKHMKIHNGEKNFKCDTCSYSSLHKNHLQRHLTIHTGEKPYKCDTCCYASAIKSNLKKHTEVHRKERLKKNK